MCVGIGNWTAPPLLCTWGGVSYIIVSCEVEIIFFSGLQRTKLKLRKDRWHIQRYTVSPHALSFFLYGRKCNSLLHSLEYSLKISTQVKKGLSHQWNLLPLVKSLSSSILCVWRILFLQSFILLARNDKNPNLHLFDNFLLRNSVTTTPDTSKILQ